MCQSFDKASWCGTVCTAVVPDDSANISIAIKLTNVPRNQEYQQGSANRIFKLKV